MKAKNKKRKLVPKKRKLVLKKRKLTPKITNAVFRIRGIKYSMLRRTDDFENDRIEVSVELDASADFALAVREAKEACEAGLKMRLKPYSTRTCDFDDEPFLDGPF